MLFYRKLSTRYKQLKRLIETLRIADIDVKEESAAMKEKK